MNGVSELFGCDRIPGAIVADVSADAKHSRYAYSEGVLVTALSIAATRLAARSIWLATLLMWSSTVNKLSFASLISSPAAAKKLFPI